MMIRESPSFFHRGPSPLARLTFFILAAIAIMIADHRFHAPGPLRLGLSVIVHPLEALAQMPGEGLAKVGDYFARQEGLLEENRELRARVLENAAAAQQS